jgi:predicted transport protein
MQPWNDQLMRDVSQIGHFGMGDLEYSLRTEDQLHNVKTLMQIAYDLRG